MIRTIPPPGPPHHRYNRLRVLRRDEVIRRGSDKVATSTL